MVALKAVEKGEVAAVLVNNYYWYALERERGKLDTKLYYLADGDAGNLVSANCSPATFPQAIRRTSPAAPRMSRSCWPAGPLITTGFPDSCSWGAAAAIAVAIDSSATLAATEAKV